MMPRIATVLRAAPVLDPATEHWIHTLQDDLALLEAEAYDQLQSDHPGAAHRVRDLLDMATSRRRDIAALRMRAEAFRD